MSNLRTELAFNRSPVFLIEVPKAALDDFPEANLDKFRPRNSRLIVGICLAPIFGLFFGVLFAQPGLKSLLADHGLGEGDTWFTVAAMALLFLMLTVLWINYLHGDWTMFAGGAVTAPLLALGLRGTVSHAVMGAAALALCTVGAVRAHQARGLRYRRLSPIFTSRHRVDGTITDVKEVDATSRASRDLSLALTIAAGGQLFTATYLTSDQRIPAIGHPVAVWLCDQDPNIQVVCINNATGDQPASLRRNPSAPR